MGARAELSPPFTHEGALASSSFAFPCCSFSRTFQAPLPVFLLCFRIPHSGPVSAFAACNYRHWHALPLPRTSFAWHHCCCVGSPLRLSCIAVLSFGSRQLGLLLWTCPRIFCVAGSPPLPAESNLSWCCQIVRARLSGREFHGYELCSSPLPAVYCEWQHPGLLSSPWGAVIAL